MGKRSTWWILVLWAVLASGPVTDLVHAQQPKPAEDEFRPITELPPEEKLPAAPLLIAAYSIVWIAAVGYLFSIWRRLDRVDRDLAELTRRLPGDRR